jgi:hypothetical protein
MKKFLFFIFVLFGICGYSQTDSLKFKNTNIVVEEVKSLIDGVITMKTSSSDKDFKTEFNLNYDNQPTAIGNEFDYVLNSGFGWELK